MEQEDLLEEKVDQASCSMGSTYVTLEDEPTAIRERIHFFSQSQHEQCSYALGSPTSIQLNQPSEVERWVF